MVQSLARKRALRGIAEVQAEAARVAQGLARAGQVSRTSVLVGDEDVFIDEAAVAASVAVDDVSAAQDELVEVGDIADDVVDVLPDMSEDSWEAEDVGQIAADGADWAAEFAIELESELEAAQAELSQALTDAQAALDAAGLARSEAAQAVTDAAAAAADAAQAVQDALAAADAAKGATPQWSTVDPVAADGAGKPVGSLWWVRDVAGKVVRMWELTALGWVQRQFSEAVVPQIAIGSGTYGALAGDRLVAKSVTAAQIQALSVTASELAANAVTAVKLAADSVTAGKIVSGAVTTDKLYALAVTAEKLAAGAVVADKIAANAITAGKLAATAIDGMTVTGATIRTAPSGQRLELDIDGLSAFDAFGSRVSTLSSNDGQITVGDYLSGARMMLTPGAIEWVDDTEPPASRVRASSGRFGLSHSAPNGLTGNQSHSSIDASSVGVSDNQGGASGTFYTSANLNVIYGMPEMVLRRQKVGGGSNTESVWRLTDLGTPGVFHSELRVDEISGTGGPAKLRVLGDIEIDRDLWVSRTVTGLTWPGSGNGWTWTGGITVTFPAGKFSKKPYIGGVHVFAAGFMIFAMVLSVSQTSFEVRFLKYTTVALASASLEYSAFER